MRLNRWKGECYKKECVWTNTPIWWHWSSPVSLERKKAAYPRGVEPTTLTTFREEAQVSGSYACWLLLLALSLESLLCTLRKPFWLAFPWPWIGVWHFPMSSKNLLVTVIHMTSTSYLCVMLCCLHGLLTWNPKQTMNRTFPGGWAKSRTLGHLCSDLRRQAKSRFHR